MVAGGHAWLSGGMHGCWGVHVVAGGGGHVWLLGGMHGCLRGMRSYRGHAWLLGVCAWLPGGMCGC